ncbi:hypothetical protein [Marixanthomonas ophiurae]|uniref:Uncharacterized protein n=1 Tax=Marixanthomonas ophiurae TaxID=387659 RepID=A0A3E1Q7A4_9FLAO|nr:hypothetical protein [Marixanthomonas ophiurae]RFN57992.1 hypothetical protein DZ858_12175 [Marixanthomonas ophiurae]
MMKKLLKLANIAFYFLMLLVFFAIGLYVAGLLEAGKNQGLAGGAIVLGYGALFGGIAFIFSFFIAYHIKHKLIVRFNWLLLLLLVITYGITHYRYLERQNKQEEKPDFKEIPPTEAKTEPTALLELRDSMKPINSDEKEMGIGFFIPNFHEHRTLYFYGAVNLEKGLTEHIPQDSIVFTLDKHKNFTTTYAPPWLLPAQLKLDYGIIHFKALGIGHEFVKIETNAQDNRIAYLDKNKGTLVGWPEYILSMNSVEFITKNNQKVHVKPLDYAGEVNADFDLITPLFVEGDWLYGVLLSDNRTENGKGWVRWRKDGKLLITYSLFS